MRHFNVKVRQKPHSSFPIPRFSNIRRTASYAGFMAKYLPSYEDLLFYASVAEQVSNYRSEYAYNSELSRGTTYLTQLSSQWPEITTAPQLVPAVHSGVDRGKLETSVLSLVYRNIEE